MSPGACVSERQVLDALRAVLDPELDRSIVDLGFVAGVSAAGSAVRVELRLPTYWCAPNFSWLMAEDARRAVLGLPGVEQVSIVLLDHHASPEISAGVSAGRSFEQTFPDDATEGLDALRRVFRRKAFFARQEQALSMVPRDRLARLRLADLPDTAEARAYLAIRAELGLDCAPAAPAVTDPDGREVRDLDAYLRWIRLMRVSLEANTALCRGLLETRYCDAAPVASTGSTASQRQEGER